MFYCEAWGRWLLNETSEAVFELPPCAPPCYCYPSSHLPSPSPHPWQLLLSSAWLLRKQAMKQATIPHHIHSCLVSCLYTPLFQTFRPTHFSTHPCRPSTEIVHHADSCTGTYLLQCTPSVSHSLSDSAAEYNTLPQQHISFDSKREPSTSQPGEFLTITSWHIYLSLPWSCIPGLS